jgi:hypothetical protein
VEFSLLEVYNSKYFFAFFAPFATPDEWDECGQGMGVVHRCV